MRLGQHVVLFGKKAPSHQFLTWDFTGFSSENQGVPIGSHAVLGGGNSKSVYQQIRFLAGKSQSRKNQRIMGICTVESRLDGDLMGLSLYLSISISISISISAHMMVLTYVFI